MKSAACWPKLAAWQAQGLVLPRVAFNMSPRSFREEGCAERVLAQLAEQGVAASQVQVEFTEGVLVDNLPVVLGNIECLHAAGVTLAVDDFGTGYSSLAYLKRLPLAELKIDKRFVDGLGREREDEAITLAIIGMAHALGLKTVAEGVETELQRDWLLAHGCDIGQGYLFAKPLEAEAFADLLDQRG